MTRCASEMALEAHLLDPGRSALGSHVEDCAACRAKLARMEREGEEFLRFVHPRTLDGLLTAREAPGRGWARLLGALVPVGGLAVAAAMFLLSPRPPADYLGVKGTALSMQIWEGSDHGAREVADGDRVPAPRCSASGCRPDAPAASGSSRSTPRARSRASSPRRATGPPW